MLMEPILVPGRGGHRKRFSSPGSPQRCRVGPNTVSILQTRKLRQENDAVIAQGWRGGGAGFEPRTSGCTLHGCRWKALGAGISQALRSFLYTGNVPRAETHTGPALSGKGGWTGRTGPGLRTAPASPPSRGRDREVTSGLQQPPLWAPRKGLQR